MDFGISRFLFGYFLAITVLDAKQFRQDNLICLQVNRASAKAKIALVMRNNF